MSWLLKPCVKASPFLSVQKEQPVVPLPHLNREVRLAGVEEAPLVLSCHFFHSEPLVFINDNDHWLLFVLLLQVVLELELKLVCVSANYNCCLGCRIDSMQ